MYVNFHVSGAKWSEQSPENWHGSVTALVFCVNLYKNGKTPVASILKDLCEMVLN